ncbi:recombinase family protein [Phocaeicola vulgatus]|uniref:recombinase family protein n=1 Tax=Phocaeicola vulgatus TaxID=821 RepID=UPI001E5B6BA2|nr:recombinase family protein [Phocaeicola vulgatus]
MSFYHSLHFTFAFGLYKGHYTYPMVAQFSTGILAHFSISIYTYLREGDTFVIWKLDRLGRSLKDLVYIVDCLQKRKIAFKSIVDGIDTNSALGRCQFGIFASLAEYEREIIVERTRAGLQAAKERGKLTGRPIGLSEDAKRKAIAAKRLYENRDYSIDEICRILHIGSKATLYRYLRYEKVRLMNRRNK